MKLEAIGDNIIVEEYKIEEKESDNPLKRGSSMPLDIICGKVVSVVRNFMNEDVLPSIDNIVFFKKEDAVFIRGKYIINEEKLLCKGVL